MPLHLTFLMSEGGFLGRLTVSFIDKELIKHKEAENKSKQQQNIKLQLLAAQLLTIKNIILGMLLV